MKQRPEYEQVEKPLLQQLQGLGWHYSPANLTDPRATHRASFEDFILWDDLRDALKRLNRDQHGQEWLDESRITQALDPFTRPRPPKLSEANQEATRRLWEGVSVTGHPTEDRGRTRVLRYVDWEKPQNNTLRVINQFRLDTPYLAKQKSITPDVVLFVNGLPWVVIECKAPGEQRALEDAVNQLQRYSNQRNASQPEGCEALFDTVQLLVVTDGNDARAGTVGASAHHYAAWKDTFPFSVEDICAELQRPAGEALSLQELLAAGMLRPAHLLDLARYFTVFESRQGKIVKKVARYQQFRAVHKALVQLRKPQSAPTATEGARNPRGGIIWHTQGSGKSLTMVFLLRKLRADPVLGGYKVVIVTDRTQLEDQLRATASLAEEPITRVEKQIIQGRTVSASERLQEVLRLPGRDLVFAMIQKYRGDADEAPSLADEASEEESYPTLNESREILVLVDEAHRSHTKTGHANLLRALPYAAILGFTGTPILQDDKKKTYQIFGGPLDTYNIKQSEEDGATLPIVYEGRAAPALVSREALLDKLYQEQLQEFTPQERQEILRRYATQNDLQTAEKLVQAKARDILRHYLSHVLPNRGKAMVVAVSRFAAVRYAKALDEARMELIERLRRIPAAKANMPQEEKEQLDAEDQFLLEARRFLPLLLRMTFAPIISGGKNDDPSWSEWTQETKQQSRIAEFLAPLPDAQTPIRDTYGDLLCMLVVKSMLLTGFDAPVAQSLYLDRHLEGAELLQAIARVNRPGLPSKTRGLVVDYYGLGDRMSQALRLYAPNDIEGAARDYTDELPNLRDRYLQVLQLFTLRGVSIIAPLSPKEKQQLAARFASYHPSPAPEGETLALGDSLASLVEDLARFLAVPVGVAPLLYDGVVGALRGLLSQRAQGEETSGEKPAAKSPALETQWPLFLEKLLVALVPERYAGLPARKRARAAWEALSQAGFVPDQDKAGPAWGVLAEAAARGEVGHLSWSDLIALMLGLVAHNQRRVQEILAHTKPEAESGAYESALQLLNDERLRAEFEVSLKHFLSALDLTMPRPEALPYYQDAKRLGELQHRTRLRYRSETRLLGAEVGAKVQALIDEFVQAQGIDPKIEPMSILDPKFQEHLALQGSPSAQASEMEHALRYHIKENQEQDPEFFERMSERLKKILQEREGRWDAVRAALEELRQEIKEGRQADPSGLTSLEVPFYALLLRACAGESPSDAEKALFQELTRRIVRETQTKTRRVGFWQNLYDQEALRDWYMQVLEESTTVEFERLAELATKLRELARANQDALAREPRPPKTNE
jgi:type I restriction enzyme R subunit